ncbi:MAG: hemerythrin domain-containing protein [Polyangiaceae bacterium]
MKRDVRLHGLSSEHHHALVLARDLRASASAWTEVDGARLGERFERELEPHFRIEEEVLLPALARIGQTPLVQRVEREHSTLRALLGSARAGVGDAARDMAIALEEHVRFEERELFSACEALLDTATLDEVARRSPKPQH